MEQKMPTEIRAGESNQITRAYFDSLLLELRYIDSVEPSTAFELYGEKFSTPIMTAALSHLDRIRPNGMVEMARGAKEAGAVMWAGMGEDEELDAITATGAKTIIVIKPYADHDLIFRKIEHARKCGVLAIGMDIDHVFNQKGQYGSVIGQQMSGKTLDDIRSFVRAAGVPFVMKGVLSVQDARKCIEAGVQGIVISHHHGIQDFAVPPLMVLPQIAAAVNRSMPIFVDCGVNSGIDAFKALALGATAVSVGRDMLGALGEEGADGVRKRIENMTHEMMAAMARTCTPDLGSVDPSVIWKKQS